MTTLPELPVFANFAQVKPGHNAEISRVLRYGCSSRWTPTARGAVAEAELEAGWNAATLLLTRTTAVGGTGDTGKPSVCPCRVSLISRVAVMPWPVWITLSIAA